MNDIAATAMAMTGLRRAAGGGVTGFSGPLGADAAAAGTMLSRKSSPADSFGSSRIDCGRSAGFGRSRGSSSPRSSAGTPLRSGTPWRFSITEMGELPMSSARPCAAATRTRPRL